MLRIVFFFLFFFFFYSLIMDERRRQRRQQRILEAGQSRLSKITGNEYCIEHKIHFVYSIDFFI